MASSATPATTSELLLPPGAGMGAVTLNVRDLEGMTAYYRDALALSVLDVAGGRAVVGRGEVPLVLLVETRDLPVARPGQAGLFHTALLFPDQAALAAVVAAAARHPRSRYVGSADHLVSEAFYFTDPEGNGIELYRDRPRETWGWAGGSLQMATLPLDAETFLAEHLVETDAPSAQPGTVGHVHLKVGDIATARRFYVDTLGFEVTVELPSALFFSAGGYHHHMAVNTWESPGAGPRAAALGLGQVLIEVPQRQELDALAARLSAGSVPTADDGRSLHLRDPWGSAVEVRAAA